MLGTTREQRGLGIIAYRPFVSLTPGSPNTVSVNLTKQFIGLLHPLDYQHEITASDGFYSMKAVIGGTEATVEWLLNELLGAHLEVRDESNEIVWEGFANSLSYQTQGVSFEYGPVMDIANKVMLRYKRIYTGTNPPTSGASVTTPVYEDQVSEERWGICPEILNGGERTEGDAAQCLLAFLDLRKNPQPKLRYASMPQDAPLLSISALGYSQYLKRAPIYVESAAEINLSTKIAGVIDAEPNNVLTSTNAHIEENTVQVPENDDSYRDAYTVLQNLIQRGTATYGRTIFMVGPGRTIVYASAPTEVEYVLRLVRGRSAVSLGWSDSFVPEYRVTAGKWAFLAGALPRLHPANTDLKKDPRALFIERVTYSISGGLEIDGSGRDSLPSALDSHELGTTAR